MAKRVLIVEDEPTARQLYRAILEEEIPGIQVDTVANGAEAVESCSSRRYSAIVMDLHMPVMDGIEAFTIIRKKSSFLKKMPPVIFCTAFAPPSALDEILLLDKGRHTLLKKPASVEELTGAVRERLFPKE